MLVGELIKELESYDKKLPVFFEGMPVVGVDLSVATINDKVRDIAIILAMSD